MVVLWTDERREWESVLPNLKSAMPELFSLGAVNVGQRTGPGVWLRMVADRRAGHLQPGQVPVIYLPGVGNGSLRTDLRALKDDPQLAPLAELQYRGIFWRQDNSKDWTLRAFFESKRHGLGLGVKGDQETLAALKRALPKLLSRALVTLDGRAIDLAFLDEILNPNPADDVLRWLADPAGLQKEKGDDWPSFVASSRQRYGIDLGKGALSAAGERFDSQPLLCVVLAGDARLIEKLRREELIPLGSRIRTRLATEHASRDELLACLNHLLAGAGNASLMTPQLRQTMCDHAAGNYRILTTLAAELLAAAAQRDLAQLDEKLYLDVFAQPEMPKPRRVAAGR